MIRALLATRSGGKVRELRSLLATRGFALIDLQEAGIEATPHEEAIEAFETFGENALAKARHFHGISGIPSFADDSGLSVDALGGRPGVRSKRWSERPELSGTALDAANNQRLVAELAALPGETARTGRYVCAAAYVDDEQELVVRGETQGTLLAEARGSGGFGYDPFFWSAELGCTFAEASLEAKGAVSHRGRAFRALLAALTRGR